MNDLITAPYRLNGYVTKKQALRKIYGGAILILLGLWVLTGIVNHLVDRSIKSVELRNLTIYHDINGFKPVK